MRVQNAVVLAGLLVAPSVGLRKGRSVVNATALASGDSKQSDWVNVCYFTNWARYRTGLVNQGKDIFEMNVIDGDSCTHFMYGFATVKPDGSGSYMLASNDPNADHPSGNGAQNGLCDPRCNSPGFTPNWSDPGGIRCDWPCGADRVMRGYEGMNVAHRAKNPNIKTLISVGGWNFNDCGASPGATNGQGSATCEIFSTIAASENNIRKFAQNIIDFCRRWGFDGFDLDWEYPVKAGHNSNTKVNGQFVETPQDYANYVNMLRILKEQFQSENPDNPLLMMAAVGVGKSTVEVAYDIPGMSKYLDLINLMTYDMHGGWEDRTGCNAPLYATEEDQLLSGYDLSVSWSIDYWIANGASPSQLTIGLGSYGRAWTLADTSKSGFNAPASGKSAPGGSTKEAGYLAYYECQARIAQGATEVYDSDRGCVYIVSGDEWAGYDNEVSVCEKIQFAKSRNLAGSMWWALDLDDMVGLYSGGTKLPLINLGGSGGAGCGNFPSPVPSPVTPSPTQAPPTPTPVPPTPSEPTPTPPPTPAPTTAPTNPPTQAPTPPPASSCCKWSGSCGGSCSSGWCSASTSSCQGCGGHWCAE